MTHIFPDTLEDGVLNRTQIATALGVSENTISEWISKGLPVQEHGGNGRAYQFLLSACWVWAKEYQDGEIAARRKSDEIANAAAAELLNLGDDPENASPLSAGDMRKLMEAELLRMQLNERRGTLINASRLRERLSDVFAAFQRALTTMPDFCEREFGLEPSEVDKLQSHCDGTLSDVRREIEAALTPPGEVVPIGSAQKDLGV